MTTKWERTNFASGARWERIVGYSRAVRVGPLIHVTGTTATGADGSIVGPGDMYVQARQSFENILQVLARAGASARDVVRTRMYVTDMSRWEEAGRAHHECFGDVMPATTMVEVSRLIDPAMLIEIEADAVVG